MPADPRSRAFVGNPLEDDSPATWERLLQALGPASMLVCIRERMGPALRRRLTPEDVWQETLLHVWRDRRKCEWRGLSAFRRWVLGVAEHRLKNAAERIGAVRRGAGRTPESLDRENGAPPPPVVSTTPSRLASFSEQAVLMHASLQDLPEDQREVVRLRLFEELSVDEVAARLELGTSAVKHRFRAGAARYKARLEARLGSQGD